MRKRTLGVVLVAGLAMSGGGAFTASNTMTAVNGGTTNVAGYGAATVTGATVLSIDYVQDTANASLMDQVKFVADGDIVGKNGSVTLWSGTTNVGNYTCTSEASDGVVVLGAALTAGDTVFTCNTADEPFAEFTSIGITVNN